MPVLLCRGEILNLELAHHPANGKQSPREQPFGKVVVLRKESEPLVRDGLHHLFELAQVGSLGHHCARIGVSKNEIPEAELPFDIFAELISQSL